MIGHLQIAVRKTKLALLILASSHCQKITGKKVFGGYQEEETL